MRKLIALDDPDGSSASWLGKGRASLDVRSCSDGYRTSTQPQNVAKGPQKATWRRYCFPVNDFATPRAQSMKSCTTGLSWRPFKVTMPIGAPVTGNSTGNFLMKA